MSKRPKNWVPSPAERYEQAQTAKKEWAKEAAKMLPSLRKDGKPPVVVGYQNLYYNEYGGFWDLSQLDEIKKPEATKKDPLEEFTDKWYEKNKPS